MTPAKYADAGMLERALRHWQEAVHHKEQAGARYGAALARGSIALTLARRGRLGEARTWAQARIGQLRVLRGAGQHRH